MTRHAMWAAAFALAACGRQADSTDTRSAPPAPAAPKSAAPAVKPAEPAAKPGEVTVPWKTDNSAALAKLQGVWLVKGFGMYGAVSAWKFDGEKVTVYNPEKKTETPDVFLFESPCAVRLDSGYGGTLVIDGDDVYLGLGGGGWKQGDVIVACMGSGTVYSTPAGCATYTKRPRWETIETTCTRSDARFVANEKSNYGESSLRFFNDHTLLTDQLAANKLTKLASWDAAKAAADKAVKAH